MHFDEEILAKELSRKKFVDRVSDHAMVDISNVEVTQIDESQFIVELDMSYVNIAESHKSTTREKYRLTVPIGDKMLSVEMMQNGYRRALYVISAARVGWEIEMDILHCLHQEHFFYENE